MRDDLINLKLPFTNLPIFSNFYKKKQCFSARYSRPQPPKLQRQSSLEGKVPELQDFKNIDKVQLHNSILNSNLSTQLNNNDNNLHINNNNDSDLNMVNDVSINISNEQLNNLDSNSAFDPPKSPKLEEFDLSINTDISDIIEKDAENDNLLKELDSYHEKITSSWKEIELIGCGSFGQVFKAAEIRTGRIFAVKKINTNLDWGINQATLQEIKAIFL
jgi:hypothetical protein